MKQTSWQFLVPLFLVLFFASLLSGRVRRAPWYEQWVWNAVSPVTSIFLWTADSTGDIWHHYFYLVGHAKKNELLTREVESLRRQTAEIEELRQENNRFRELLGLQQEAFPQSIAARVTAYDPASDTWSTGLAPITTPRGQFAIAAYGGSIFVWADDGQHERWRWLVAVGK